MDANLLEHCIKFLLIAFSIIFLFGFPVFLALHSEYQKAGMVCLFAIIFLLAMNADKIRGFKFWGLEAELKETISEANATIGQLKMVAATVSEAALTDIMAGSFMGGMQTE